MGNDINVPKSREKYQDLRKGLRYLLIAIGVFIVLMLLAGVAGYITGTIEAKREIAEKENAKTIIQKSVDE